MSSSSPADGAAGNAPKTVFLVRHAQSEQNVATARLSRGEVGALGDIIQLGHDAPVSAAGAEQLAAAATRLDGFASRHAIELVAHSPYARAVATARALFSGHPKPLVLLPPLHERTVAEYFFPWMLDARIQQVRDWLDSRDERCIALVGHGQFFKRCLQASSVQPNVSILRSTYSSSEGFVPARDGVVAFPGFPEPSGAPPQPT